MEKTKQKKDDIKGQSDISLNLESQDSQMYWMMNKGACSLQKTWNCVLGKTRNCESLEASVIFLVSFTQTLRREIQDMC